MKTIPFNVNEYVRVKLKPAGLEILEKQHLPFIHLHPFNAPIIDAEGYSRLQLWEFMSMFGASITGGGESPFETEILIECRSKEAE